MHAQSGGFEYIGVINARFEPLGGMINVGDGYFYGVASSVESGKGGVIYRLAPGQEAEAIYTFGPVEDTSGINYSGSGPSCPLIVGHDGAFYGVTDWGGANGMGTIYRVSTDGIFSVIHDKGPQESYIYSMIATPGGGLMAASSGGGPEGAGCLLESGADGVFRMVSSFQLGPSFPSPVPEGSRRPFHSPGLLAVGSDGEIYGMFSQGGLIYPHGSFRFTYGGMFRYDGPGQETVLKENPQYGDQANLGVAVEDGFVGTTNGNLVKVSLQGQITALADLSPSPSFPSVSLVLGDVVYGTSFYGGESQSGYIFRYAPGDGFSIIHQFSQEYYSRPRCLVAGNDGLVYGIATVPNQAATLARSIDAKARKVKKPVAIRAFRFRPPGASPNFVPVAKPDQVWLPGKPIAGIRTVVVDVLKNDRDPDGHAMTLLGLGEGIDPAFATIVDTPEGKRVRISTSEGDPASRLVTYQVSDDQGGTATGRLAVKSLAAGKFAGLASSEGVPDAPLFVTIGKNNSVSVALRLNGRRYTGKGQLDIDDTGDISLRTKDAPALILRLDLLRDPARRIQATFATGGSSYTATCEIKAKK